MARWRLSHYAIRVVNYQFIIPDIVLAIVDGADQFASIVSVLSA